jgi:tripartite-type tricarboxylate transporter receptor subunit TctC
MKNYLGSLTLSIFLVIALAGYVSAAFPDRPLTLIVNYSAGGTADLSARALAKSAEKFLGQPIAVVNKAGAAGTIGVGALAASRPDGYTIGVSTSGPMTMSPHITDLPYDPLKDIEFIMGFGRYMYGICVRSDSPFKTFKDLVEYAKANPGKIKYSTVGLATPNHFGMVMLAKLEGIKWDVVIFKNSPDTVTAVLGGHVDAVVMNPVDVVSYIEAGRLRLLASLDDTRWKWVPDVPTVRELGYNFAVTPSALGLAVPKGVPKPILDKLQDAFKKSVDDPSFLEIMNRVYLQPRYVPGEEFQKWIEESYKAYEGIIKELGLHKSQQQKK